MRIVLGILAATALCCASGGQTATETRAPALEKVDARGSVEVRLDLDVRWEAIRRIRVLDTRFELDTKHHRRGYDQVARRIVDRTLSDADRKHLDDSFGSALRNRICEERLPSNDEPMIEGTLLLEPVILRVKWSRPPVRAYTGTGYVDSRSVQAGGANVRIDAFLVADGKRRLVASIIDRWEGNLGDTIPRLAIWEDTDRGFHAFARRLGNLLRDFDVPCTAPSDE